MIATLLEIFCNSFGRCRI